MTRQQRILILKAMVLAVGRTTQQGASTRKGQRVTERRIVRNYWPKYFITDECPKLNPSQRTKIPTTTPLCQQCVSTPSYRNSTVKSDQHRTCFARRHRVTWAAMFTKSKKFWRRSGLSLTLRKQASRKRSEERLRLTSAVRNRKRHYFSRRFSTISNFTMFTIP